MDTEVCSTVLKRWEVIDSLRTGAKDKRTLVESLACSRSTVDRAVRELESIGVIKYVDGEYAATPLGETIAGGFEETMETVELRLELEPFLKWIPDDDFDLDFQHLQDAELLLPEPGDPWAMVNRHVAVLRQAGAIRCLLPLIGLHAHETIHQQIVENGAEAELIVVPDVARTLQTAPEYAELTAEMAATGRYHLFQYEDPIPYFVGVLDEIIQIGVDEDGEPRALVETTNPVVRDWGETTIKEYKQRAKPVQLSSEVITARS